VRCLTEAGLVTRHPTVVRHRYSAGAAERSGGNSAGIPRWSQEPAGRLQPPAERRSRFSLGSRTTTT